MKRASDVPPVVESFGVAPVTSLIAPETRSTKAPGSATNESAFDGSQSMCQRTLLARTFGRPPLDQHLERRLAVAIVEADVEARARLAGDEVDDRVSDVDGGEFEVRRVEMRAAMVERRRHQRAHQRDQAAHRIVGALG